VAYTYSSSLAPTGSNPAREQFALISFSSIEALAECSRAEILVFNALALHADTEGHCWPGRERLATITHLPLTRVSKATTGLERKGMIRKEATNGVRVDYWLLPQGSLRLAPVLELNATRDQNGTAPVTETAPEQTRQQTIDQRAAGPEPEPPEPPAPAPLSPSLRNAKTTAPDTLPESWIEQGKRLRPDLDEQTIRNSGAIFLDTARSQGRLLVDWKAGFNAWLRRERAPRTARSGLQAAQKPGCYAIPTAPAETQESAVLAFESQMRRLGASLQPDGVWRRPDGPPVAPIPPVAAPTPTPRPLAPAPRVVQRLTAEETRRLAELVAAGRPLAEVAELRAQIGGAAVGG